jgi:ligand-binding sensor domain-containing protein
MDVWQVEQGLPDSTVTSIVQTPDGYLWFGTFNGLVRFDGVRFTIFDSRTPGLESERVLRLFLDGQGGLWISMEQGQLSRYAGGRFTAFRREDGWVMEACLTRGMALDRSGRMTFLTIGSHLVQFDGKGFRSVALEAIPDTSNSGLAMDGRDGQLWLRHGTSLGQFDDGKWKRDYAVLSEERLQRDNGTMCGSRSGGIWTINDRRLMRLRKDGEVA